MLVGVKFCGGCNPRYDRTACLEEVKRQHSHWDFQYAEEGRRYDLLLVIGGCPSCCASDEAYQFKRLIKVGEEKELPL